MPGSAAFLVATLFCNLLALPHLQFVVSKPNGFSLKLIHRDSPESPLYPGKLTPFQQFRRLAEISKTRASYLGRMRQLGTRYSTNPSITRPTITRIPDLLYNTLYVVNVSIGTPKTKLHLVLDTATDLTWTQCLPCFPCLNHPYLEFIPKWSSSYKTLPPDHSLSKYFNCSMRKCQYTRDRGAEIFSGVVSMETFSFNSGTQVPKNAGELVFGCVYQYIWQGSRRRNNYTRKYTGRLGMNMSPLSLIGQLGDRVKQKFSYCLHSVISPKKTSFLRFGANIVRKGGNIQKISFMQQPQDNMYRLNMIDISIGGLRLELKSGIFQAGCIIDSGTGISSIPHAAHVVVKNTIQKHFDQLKLKRVSEEGYLCYRHRKGFNNFPNMTFHFQGAKLEVPPTNLFFFQKTYFCLALEVGKRITSLGAFQQQNVRFTYDLAKKELSFASDDCSKDAS